MEPIVAGSGARHRTQGPQWVRAPPPSGPSPRPPSPADRPEGSNQRQHILSTALSLMAQQGVDGTSMRNLAAATGLNVASLYHYFPSKRDLLVAVLEERGFVDDPASPPDRPCPGTRPPDWPTC